MALQEKLGIDERINEAFQPISNFWEGLILHEFFGTGIPTIIFLLVGGAAFFTLYFGFINIRGFGLSLRTVMGRYDGLDEKRKGSGEVSHFQALATAVSGTVGNGNIAGVAMAIAIGGPGATFWMILCGLLGMSSKFVECTLGVKYRDVGEDGTVYGGPMYYLSKGLKERGFEKFGKVLAVIFAILCIGASFGGGNAAQSNQAALQMVDLFGLTGGSARTIVGVIMMIVVGIIIIGGIKRIASVTEKIVPFMAGMYVLACLYIIFSNLSFVDDAFAMIINGAFAPTAAVGGFIGVLIQGFRRGAFSNEAGIGMAPMAHGAAKTNNPIKEGFVAMLAPAVDTLVVCTMTAMAILVTDVWKTDANGVSLTASAFESSFPVFGNYILLVCVLIFSISSLFSYSYYGTKCLSFLMGDENKKKYNYIYIISIMVGATTSLSMMINLIDTFFALMAIPTMIATLLLAPKVVAKLKEYEIKK